MPDRESITIPAPIARPGERVEVRDRSYWRQATLFSARYTEQVGGLQRWEYTVVFVTDTAVTVIPYYVMIRRAGTAGREALDAHHAARQAGEVGNG